MEKLKDNSRYIDIDKYIFSRNLRTVDSFKLLKTEDERRIEFVAKDSFLKKLNFKAPWDGHLFGYYRITGDLIPILEKGNINPNDDFYIYLVDWDKSFLLSFETDNRENEIVFFVDTLKVKTLLENCLRIPSQCLKK